MKKLVSIDYHSRIPKYKQIVDSIVNEISLGNLKIGERIPSINQLSEYCDLSRDTVEKAYKILREDRVIISVKGKGYYTAKTDLISKINVYFLINKLSTYKMQIYNSFVKSIGSTAHTNLSIYHCDETLFLNLIARDMGAHDYYVIMPHFKTDDANYESFTTNVVQAIDKIPHNKLIILDNKWVKQGNFNEISQDFENDIYNALKEALDRILTYKKNILIYPDKAVYPYPTAIIRGFRKFCVEFSMDFEILDEVHPDMILKKGDLFITIEESDLVNLVKLHRDKNLVLGQDIGIISYNDTPLKELLGITVISTDFKIMGQTAAQMILNKECKKIKNPFNLIVRNSL